MHLRGDGPGPGRRISQPQAQESDRGPIVKLQLKTGPSFLGELLSETDAEIRWLDLNTGLATAAKKADLI